MDTTSAAPRPPHARALRRAARVLDLVRQAAWSAPDRPMRLAGPAFPFWRKALSVPAAAGVLLLAVAAAAQLSTLVPPGLAWALCSLQVLPLLVAPVRPLTAWRIATAGMLLTVLAESPRIPEPFWPWPAAGCAAYLMLVFGCAITYGRRISLGAIAVVLLVVLLPAVPLTGLSWLVLAVAVFITTLVLLLGEAIHSRREAERSLVQAEEQRRRDLARQAVLEERSRIARELHDVVAHHMSMVAIQAEAAPYKTPGLPPQALRSFTAIREASTTALTEMRRVIGLLREEDEDLELAPQPGIGQIPDMVQTARTAGMQVDLSLTLASGTPPAGVDVSAYRIVQEALSNAGRHAPGARVEVEVVQRGDAVVVRVSDDGRGHGRPPVPDAAWGGHGLVGMRERVAMLGGTLRAGPRGGADGGFEVRAELPVDLAAVRRHGPLPRRPPRPEPREQTGLPGEGD
ncbi:sensor histidine kinase [Streptacidiphilus sp. ASG 303]|uniref:sensor histidine kinase n=1 Tax=Streptacidiphilus sp. ASG 303 TaxID=2896847 RepID=UPI001E652C8E|nr:sensor histidine kinase [Streptacidiphilus sp. ASG 303]MCD0483958.1 sensor histidine kinase [Streptacidiphilus sp. ASG 303]